MENVAKKQSLLERILDGAIDAIKRPFVVKRIERGFSSAADSLEEQLLGAEAEQNSARERLVAAAKVEGNLSSYIQELINLQNKVTSLKTAQESLATEKETLLK
jgi:hypothetical protein